jgi:hypothetical protein
MTSVGIWRKDRRPPPPILGVSWDYAKPVNTDAVVEYIRKYGDLRYFGKKRRPFTQLGIGEYTYWTMGDPIEETWILNRARVNDPARARLMQPALPVSDRVPQSESDQPAFYSHA